ncbi:hypothetical protein CAP36_00600 [Chitinophagaceae bacterium IBVUCB2]|nr:hypothetical protein CAP36_00600 [Chitinophagaceae bacterium IBVUCB2]
MANELEHKCVGFIYIKIKPQIMQTARILQAVTLMMIVALAASCASSKEYTSKLFAPRTPALKDSQAVALRFLELDAFDAEKQGDGWVTTDIITGRDTTSQTAVLDNFVKTFPVKKDTLNNVALKDSKEVKTTPVLTEPAPVAKNAKPGEVRSKKTREK